jgi:regulatory protein
MAITDIQRQKRNTNRLSIYIDGKYAFSLDYDTLAGAGLHVGDEVTDELKAELVEKDGFARARDYAYSLLSYRDRTAHEIRERLGEKGFERTLVERVIALLREKGFVDDRAFALKWVDDIRASRPMGRLRIEHELRRRRVADRIIDEVCDLRVPIDAERELAESAAEKRIRVLAGHPREEAMRKLEAFLRGRGFDFDIIRELVKRYFGESRERGEVDDHSE